VTSDPATAEAPHPRVAVMQPYLFPYLGYYQLAAAVDDFVFLDDVGFIKQGWVNRNHVLLDGAAHRFTAPVRDMSSFRTIAQHEYVPKWTSLRGLLASAYRKAPQWRALQPLLDEILDDADENVARKNARSVRLVFEYLGAPAPRWSVASEVDPQPALRGAERVMALCRAKGGATYVNSPGGRELYASDVFAAQGLALRFLASGPVSYPQVGAGAFVPHLSMLDVLMHASREDVRALLGRCALEA
jgi:hypothetical protein